MDKRLLAECMENYEIKKLTTFKVGGIVNKLYLPKTQNELISLLKNLDEYILLGNCSNVLFSSNGYKGNLILTTQMKNYEINEDIVTAECGVKGQCLSQKACEFGLSGFEFMIGFPGTIGGEVYMNASAHSQSISDSIVKCCLFDKVSKNIVYMDKSDMHFEYRKSILQNCRYILLSAEFKLKEKSVEEIKLNMQQNLKKRSEFQPNLSHPNAGSVFKNPQGDSAGRLLDMVGAKQFKCGDAEVWKNHANFIVNTKNASSEDVLGLMLKMYTAVKEKFKIELVPEVINIGDKTKKEEEICKILYQKTLK